MQCSVFGQKPTKGMGHSQKYLIKSEKKWEIVP